MLTIILLVTFSIIIIRLSESSREKPAKNRIGTVMTYSLILGGLMSMIIKAPIEESWTAEVAISLLAAVLAVGLVVWASSITNRYHLEKRTYPSESTYVIKSLTSGFSVMLLFLSIGCFAMAVREAITISSMVDRTLLTRASMVSAPELSIEGVGIATVVLGFGVLVFEGWQSRKG